MFNRRVKVEENSAREIAQEVPHMQMDLRHNVLQRYRLSLVTTKHLRPRLVVVVKDWRFCDVPDLVPLSHKSLREMHVF